MPLTPQITLTAHLETILAGADTGGYLRITLCGSGPVMPAVPGTCMLADATIPQIVGPQVGAGPLSIELFGNDVIEPGPDVTFYEIAVLDDDKNVIQAGMYRFDGAGTIDLSEAVQIMPPYGFPVGVLAVRDCVGAVPGSHYLAPGTPVVAVIYNGTILDPNAVPTPDYTLVGPAITLSFNTQVGDKINALCVV
ncbi:MAG TPA: hypothetical protein VFE27_24285 [Acidobacteriaceae bacterium]|jgi:hypothetical protein|nr:hypothetical protein [Acidobacteriaceae bacterium]